VGEGYVLPGLLVNEIAGRGGQKNERTGAGISQKTGSQLPKWIDWEVQAGRRAGDGPVRGKLIRGARDGQAGECVCKRNLQRPGHYARRKKNLGQ